MSTSDVAAHERLFGDVFGMEVIARRDLDGPGELTALGAGPEIDGASVSLLRTPGVDSGVALVAYRPTSEVTVRDWATRVDRDALKVIDFYAPDFDGAIAHARALGYEVLESEASYELPEGTFREAHLWGPDNVVTALLGGPKEFFADFAQVLDRRVSEVQSISAPLTDATAAVDFYREVLGWESVYEYAIDDPSFAEMLGVDDLQLRSRNVGPSTREPYFGLIDYGLPADHGGSIAGRSVPPHRGLLGAVVLSDDLDAVARAAGQGDDVVAFDLPELGASRGLWLRTPHTVGHLVLEVGAGDGAAAPGPQEGNTTC